MRHATTSGNGAVSGLLMQFGAWMATRRYRTTPAQIIERFGVSRSTAYRWLTLWREVQP